MDRISQTSTLTKKTATKQDVQLDNAIRDISNVTSRVNNLSELNLNTASFSSFMTAVNNGSAKIGLIGTSITEGWAAQMEGYNTWAQEFMRRLTNKYPNTTFTLENMGLTGRKLSSFIDPNFVGIAFPDPGDETGYYRATTEWTWATPSTIGKSWIDHVKEREVDMLVINFGMNDTDSPEVFRANMITTIESALAWDKAPYIVLTTEALPTKNSPYAYIDYIGRIKAYNREIRDLASIYGAGLIDIGREWELLLTGQDPLNFQWKKISLDKYTLIQGTVYDAATYNSMSIAGTFGNSVYGSANTAAGYIYKDLTVTGTLTPETANGAFQCGLRFYSPDPASGWKYGIAVQVMQSKVVIWEENAIVQQDNHALISIGVAGDFSVSIIDDEIIVYVEGVLVSTYTITTKRDVGRLAFGVYSGAISNIDLQASMFPIIQTAKYTGNQLLGNVSGANWNAGDFTDGGNTTVHPSRIGLSEAYYPAIHKFIDLKMP